MAAGAAGPPLCRPITRPRAAAGINRRPARLEADLGPPPVSPLVVVPDLGEAHATGHVSMEEKRAGAERGGSLGQSGRGRTVLPVRKRIHCGTCRFCFCFFARIFFTRTAHAAEQLFSPAAKREAALPRRTRGGWRKTGGGRGERAAARAAGGAGGGQTLTSLVRRHLGR